MVLAFIIAAAITDNQTTAQTLYKKSQAAVVTINTPTMSGTGFVVGDGSLVLTCFHVVKESPDAITVKGFGHASLLRSDAQADIAVLSLGKKAPYHLNLASGSAPSPGAQVFVIGSPLGVLEKSITEGTLSSVRHIGDRALLQITAPISHGSSGSPVLDRNGQVIGMAAASLEQGQSLNFAISSFNLRTLLSQASNKSRVASTLPWKPELCVACSVPLEIYEKMDLKSEYLFSARRNEAIDVAKAKVNGWYSTRFRDGSLGYLLVKDTHTASKKEISDTGKTLDIPPKIKKLISDLASYEKRKETTRQLLAIGSDALPYLAYEARVPGDGGDPKIEVSWALSGFGPLAESQLLDMLRNGNRYERSVASAAISDMAFDATTEDKGVDTDTEKQLRVLEFLHKEVIVDALISALDDFAAREDAFEAIGYLKLDAAHDRLMALINDDDNDIAESALTALANFANSDDKPAVLEAAQRLVDDALEAGDKKNPADNLRVGLILDGLALAGNDVAREVVTTFLDDSDPALRYHASVSVRMSGDKWFLPSIETLLKDENEVVQATALHAAATLRGEGYYELIREASKSDIAYVRRIAAQCVSETKSSMALQAILGLVDDKEKDVRAAMVEAIAATGGLKAKESLEKLSKDSDPNVRKSAKEALAALSKGNG